VREIRADPLPNKANLGRVHEIRADSRGEPTPLRVTILAEVVTDANGRFELACPSIDGAQLEIGELPTLRMQPAYRELDRTACTSTIEWSVRVSRRE
jgi:hypothetical protein